MKKPKIIAENEPFIMNNSIWSYSIKEGVMVLKKGDVVLKGKVSKISKSFVPPTLKDVTDYFITNGYSADLAKTFFNGYENGDPAWHDSRGNPVRAWKQKAIQVWFKPEAKVKDTPKAFFQE